MTRREWSELVAAAVAIGALVFVLLFSWFLPPAHAEDPSVPWPSSGTHAEDSCVTKWEWRRARQVLAEPGTATLDTLGRYLDGPGTASLTIRQRTWGVCGKPWDRRRVVATFDGEQVTGLFMLWLYGADL